MVIMRNKFNMTFNRQTGHGSILHFIQSNRKISEKLDLGTKVFLSQTNVMLKEDHCHSKWYPTVVFAGVYHHIKKQVIKFWKLTFKYFVLFCFLFSPLNFDQLM